MIFRALLIFVLGYQISFSQDTTRLLNDRWITLKNLLLKRSNLGTQLAQQSKDANTALSKRLEKKSSSLSKILNLTEIPDSVNITKIHNEDDSLSTALKEFFEFLLNNKDLIQNEKYRDIEMQLEGNENRIYISIQSFNDFCKAIKREDLFYKERSQ